MTPEEFERRKEELLDELYDLLALGVVNLRGRDFWAYQSKAIRELGYPLLGVRAGRAVVKKLTDLLLNPKQTTTRSSGASPTQAPCLWGTETVSQPDVIHVVLASDANYAMPLAAAICSAAASCDRGSRLQFRVIQRGIGPDLRRKIESSLERTGAPGAGIRWLELGDGRLDEFRVVHSNHTALIYAPSSSPI